MSNSFFSSQRQNAVFPEGKTLVPAADMLADDRSGAQFQALKSEVDALRQWKAQATQLIEVLMQSTGQASQGAAFPQHSQGFQDPMAFADMVADHAMSQVQSRLEVERLLNEFRSKNQDLQPFETSILLEAQQIANNARLHEQPIDDREAIEQAIQVFRSRLSSFSGGSDTSQNLLSGQGKALQHMALKLDAGAASTDFKKLSADEIFHMPPEKFEQLRSAIRQKQQFR